MAAPAEQGAASPGGCTACSEVAAMAVEWCSAAQTTGLFFAWHPRSCASCWGIEWVAVLSSVGRKGLCKRTPTPTALHLVQYAHFLAVESRVVHICMRLCPCVYLQWDCPAPDDMTELHGQCPATVLANEANEHHRFTAPNDVVGVVAVVGVCLIAWLSFGTSVEIGTMTWLTAKSAPCAVCHSLFALSPAYRCAPSCGPSCVPTGLCGPW